MSDIMSAPPQPVNYTGLQIQADPVSSFLKAAQAQAGINLTNAQTQNTQQAAQLNALAVQRQQNYQNAWQSFSQNPTPQGAVQMAMSNPEWAQQVSGAWGQYNEQRRQQSLDLAAPVVSALQNDRYDLAASLVQNHIAAIQNTPGYEKDPTMQQDLQGAQQMLSTIQGDTQNGTKNALAYLYGTLAAAQGPQDFMTHFGQGATMGSTINQATANVNYTNAQTTNVQSEVQNRASQFQLDQNRFLADLQLRLKQMNWEENSPNMDDRTRQQILSGQMDAVQYGQMADRTGTLLSNVATMGQNGQWGATGKPGDVANWWKSVWGNQDNMSLLRSEYQAVTQNKNGLVFSGLPPEQQKALATMPPPNANDQSIVQYLSAVQNAERRQARFSDGVSNWAATFGWAGPAKYDANVGGVQITKGTSLSKFLQQQLATGSQSPSAFPAPTASPGVQIKPPSTSVPSQAVPLSGAFSSLNRYITNQ